MVTFPDTENRRDVWEVHISEPNLLHVLLVKKFSGIRRYYNINPSDIPQETIVESAQVGLEFGYTLPELNGCNSDDIKHLLLTTHREICTEIIFLLLCSKHETKWRSIDEECLMNDFLCSSKTIFKEFTFYKMDGIMHTTMLFIQNMSPDNQAKNEEVSKS